MTTVKPFQALYYNAKKTGDLSKQLAPPYDVISSSERDYLYERSEFNIVRIVLGKDEKKDSKTNNRYTRAADYFSHWLGEKVFEQLKKPSMFLYDVEFELGGKKMLRRGLVAVVGVEDFSEKKIIPHEKTFPKCKQDRLNLIRECHANFSPLFAVYDGKGFVSRIVEKQEKKHVFLEALDRDGFKHTLRLVEDEKILEKLQNFFEKKQILIADGHHRYETALSYYKETLARGKENGSRYVMMLLVDMDDPGLIIMPTYRVVKKMKTTSLLETKKALSKHFRVEQHDFDKENELEVRKKVLKKLDKAKQHCFVLSLKDVSAYLFLSLKKTVDPCKTIPGKQPCELKKLDATLLHHLIFPLLKVENAENIRYVKDASEALRMVHEKEQDAVFLLKPTKKTQLKKVTSLGELMPHKSTYFYPKPLSGILVYKH